MTTNLDTASEFDTTIVIRLEGSAAAREAIKNQLGQELVPKMSPWFRLYHGRTADPDQLTHETLWFRTRLVDHFDPAVERPAKPTGSVWVELSGPANLVAKAEKLLRRYFWCGTTGGSDFSEDDVRFEVDPGRPPTA